MQLVLLDHHLLIVAADEAIVDSNDASFDSAPSAGSFELLLNPLVPIGTESPDRNW